MTTLTAAALRARVKLTHKAFQSQVVQLATLCGWKCHYVYDSRKSPSGWPDIFGVRGPDRFAAELKVGKDTVKPAQTEWLMALNMAGIPAFVWTPDSWPTIQEVLTGEPK